MVFWQLKDVRYFFEGEFFEFAFFCVFDLEVTDGGEVADDAGEFSAGVLAFWWWVGTEVNVLAAELDVLVTEVNILGRDVASP